MPRTMPSQSPVRTLSLLPRSSELLSMESELRDLLKASSLNHVQKKAFNEMLKSTFDLFQTPLYTVKTGDKTESLIDSSSVALFSKMQSLVSALTALIVEEEMETRLEEGKVENSFDTSNDCVDFYNNDQTGPHFFQNDSRSLSRLSLNKSNTYRRSPVLKSPSFQSPILPRYNHSPIQPDQHRQQHDQHKDENHRSLQPLTTPIPRSFSSTNTRTSKRYSFQPQHYQNLNQHAAYVSPDSERSFSFIKDNELTRTSSIGSKKRYSMRF